MKPKSHSPLTIDDLKTLLNGFETAISILTSSRDTIDEVIACIEEAGGISVRARDTLKTSAGYEGNKSRLEELEIRYKGALSKIDGIVDKASIKGVNLLKGESLYIQFETTGKNPYEIRGISLTTKALEFRPPIFTTIELVQNNRIDVMNAVDIATTLRHLICSDLFLLQGREEFSKETMANLQNPDDTASTPSLKEAAANLIALQVRQQLSEDDTNLASEAQREILSQF
jgi:flagellin